MGGGVRLWGDGDVGGGGGGVLGGFLSQEGGEGGHEFGSFFVGWFGGFRVFVGALHACIEVVDVGVAKIGDVDFGTDRVFYVGADEIAGGVGGDEFDVVVEGAFEVVISAGVAPFGFGEPGAVAVEEKAEFGSEIGEGLAVAE